MKKVGLMDNKRQQKTTQNSPQQQNYCPRRQQCHFSSWFMFTRNSSYCCSAS